MSKLTFNDLPAAVEALMLRIDILHDLVKSTRDRLDELIKKSGESQITDKKPKNNAPHENLPAVELLDIGKAARFLGISNSKLYMAVERRQIAHFRKLNRIFFKINDLQSFKERQKPTETGQNKPLQDEPTIILGETNDKLLTMEEAVEHTGFTKSNLYAFIKSHKVPFVKKGRRLYFPVVALNQLMIMSSEKPAKTRGRRKKSSSEGESGKGRSDPDYIGLRNS